MPRRHQPRAGLGATPGVIWVLIGVNALVYGLWNTLGRQDAGFQLMASHFLVSQEAVWAGRVWTLLTSTISHIDPGHLLFNMLALWVFGSDVARVLGSRRLVQLYLVGGLVASAAHVAFSLFTADPTPALGASGSVMAIAVVFGALYPRRTLLINFLVPVPAALAVAAYIVLDVLGLFSGGGTVAHAAHLGGAAWGLLYWLLAVRPRKVSRRR